MILFGECIKTPFSPVLQTYLQQNKDITTYKKTFRNKRSLEMVKASG